MNNKLHPTERIVSEEMLQFTEEKYASVFRFSPDFIILTSVNKGIILEINDAAIKTLEYKPEELIGQKVIELNIWLRPELRNYLYQELLLHKNFSNRELEFRTKSGQIKTCLLSGEIISLGNSSCIIWSGKDITEIKETQKTLKNQEIMMANIIDFLPDAILVIDNNGTLLSWNRAAEKMTGILAEEIIGQNNYAYSIPFYGMRRPTLADITLNNGSNWSKSYSNFKKNGLTVYGEHFCPAIGNSGAFLSGTAAPLYNSDNKIIGAIECIRDITEWHNRQQALHHSELKFHRAFNCSPSLMAITKLKTGEFIEVNNRFCEATGYLRENVIGTSSADLFWTYPEEREYFKNKMCKSGSIRNMEIRFKTRFNEVRTGLLSSDLFSLEGKEFMITSVFDITEHKQMQENIARLAQLHLVGEIAANFGHEIRNPMTAVRGFLQLIKDNQSISQIDEYLTIIIDEIDRANYIVSEFLSLARNKALELKPHNLNEIINAISPLIQAQAVSQETMFKTCLGNIPDLLLDDKEIRQLILNLVNNGLEAMCSGGTLTISTFVENNEVILAVTDEGPGISPEIQDIISRPFFTTKKTGTGLGLAICYSIANHHDAHITISTSSDGTTFYVHFKK